MNELADIREQVEKIVNDKSSQIVLGVYNYMIKKHNPDPDSKVWKCDCDYCVQLKEYVRYKKFKSRLYRRASIDYYSLEQEKEAYFDMQRVVAKIKHFKAMKTHVKNQAMGIPSVAPVYQDPASPFLSAAELEWVKQYMKVELPEGRVLHSTIHGFRP